MLVLILSQINPVHDFPRYFLKLNFNIIIPIYVYIFQMAFFPQVGLPEPSTHLSFSHTRYLTHPFHFSLFDRTDKI